MSQENTNINQKNSNKDYWIMFILLFVIYLLTIVRNPSGNEKYRWIVFMFVYLWFMMVSFFWYWFFPRFVLELFNGFNELTDKQEKKFKKWRRNYFGIMFFCLAICSLRITFSIEDKTEYYKIWCHTSSWLFLWFFFVLISMLYMWLEEKNPLWKKILYFVITLLMLVGLLFICLGILQYKPLDDFIYALLWIFSR